MTKGNETGNERTWKLLPATASESSTSGIINKSKKRLNSKINTWARSIPTNFKSNWTIMPWGKWRFQQVGTYSKLRIQVASKRSLMIVKTMLKHIELRRRRRMMMLSQWRLKSGKNREHRRWWFQAILRCSKLKTIRIILVTRKRKRLTSTLVCSNSRLRFIASVKGTLLYLRLMRAEWTPGLSSLKSARRQDS
jgi:hypothetical protein